MKRRRKIRGAFCESREAPKARFDRRSFRTIKSGSSWLIIGCPRGKWNAKKKSCRGSTSAYKILRPTTDTCSVGEHLIRK